MSGMTRLGTPTPQTATGSILGTIQYMAPEQVEGKEADARSDIWALGAVVYEMATGARPFAGDTPASVIGAILKDEPPPLSSRQPLAPAALDAIVATCLAKDPDERWQAAADLRKNLTWVTEGGALPRGAPMARTSTRRRVVLTTIAAALALAWAAVIPLLMTHVRERPPGTVRLAVFAPAGAHFVGPQASVIAPQVAVSPDGLRVAFIAAATRERPMVWIRKLDTVDAQVVTGTEDAQYPFWSPDSQSIGFFAQGKLKRIDISGGPPITLTDAPFESRGGSWGADGTIIFSPAAAGVVHRIAATGGPSTAATRLDSARKEAGHRFPSFLPDGRHFLYELLTERAEHRGVYVASLDAAEGKRVIDGTDWGAQYVAPGYILFLRGTTLMAQPFDAKRLTTTGAAVPVAESVGATSVSYGAFSASQTGVLAYADQLRLPGELRWFDRAGIPIGLVAPDAEYIDFELSPDERSLAYTRLDPQPNTSDIWLLDLARGITTRFTTDPLTDARPLWSPDGGRIVFRSNRLGATSIFLKRSTGAGVEEVALRGDRGTLVPNDWSADGRYILYTNLGTGAGLNIWAWPISGDRKPQAVIRTQSNAFNAMHGRISPDGRWIAYSSDESGEQQVYVQPFPSTGDKWQISRDGGSEPRWSRDGKELFYLASNLKLIAVPMAVVNGHLDTGVARTLFDTHVPLTGNVFRTNYAVAGNGQRFLLNTSTHDASPTPITVVLNWTAALHK